MTVSAADAKKTRVRRRVPVRPNGDRLVPFGEAARVLGRSPDMLREWHTAGHMPAVVTPGKQWMTFESFIAAVLVSARPGQAGEIAVIGREWFAAHTEAVA